MNIQIAVKASDPLNSRSSLSQSASRRWNDDAAVCVSIARQSVRFSLHGGWTAENSQFCETNLFRRSDRRFTKATSALTSSCSELQLMKSAAVVRCHLRKIHQSLTFSASCRNHRGGNIIYQRGFCLRSLILKHFKVSVSYSFTSGAIGGSVSPAENRRCWIFLLLEDILCLSQRERILPA